MTTDIVGFSACALVITLSGTQLSRHGSRLADLTGLSRAWIGLILMATVTSLPEMLTGLSSIVIVNAPDLATGNVLGSCAFNLLILSVLDMMVKKPITSLVKSSHVVVGSYSIILLSFVAVAILLESKTPELMWFSPFSLLIVLTYISAMRGVFFYEKTHPADEGKTDLSQTRTKRDLKRAISIYCLHAMVVVLAALFLPYFGEHLAQRFGLSDSFFGTVFLAITTSLPELVISVSALRIGSLDMAMGNLLGSNVFNIGILGVLDFFYPAGSLYAAMSSTHLISILGTIIMTAVVAIGLVTRPQKKTWKLSMDAWVILITYVMILWMLI